MAAIEHDIASLLSNLKTLQITARTILTGEGRTDHHLYFIHQGAIRVWLNRDGKDITLQFFFEGEGATSLESFLYN